MKHIKYLLVGLGISLCAVALILAVVKGVIWMYEKDYLIDILLWGALLYFSYNIGRQAFEDFNTK